MFNSEMVEYEEEVHVESQGIHGDRGRAPGEDVLYSMLVCTASLAGAGSTVFWEEMWWW